MRAEALNWLRVNLEMRRKKMPVDLRTLQWWKRDPDLASVRDGDQPEERRALWREVDAAKIDSPAAHGAPTG